MTQGVKAERSAPADVAAAVASMVALNRDAADAMIEVGVSAATDVTGFGLLGHLHEVAHASGVAARVTASSVPLLPGARALAQAGIIPGGSRRNAEQFARWIDWGEGVDAATRTLLCDAQTSGGLLVAIPAARAGELAAAFARRDVHAAAIGVLEPGEAGRIVVG